MRRSEMARSLDDFIDYALDRATEVGEMNRNFKANKFYDDQQKWRRELASQDRERIASAAFNNARAAGVALSNEYDKMANPRRWEEESARLGKDISKWGYDTAVTENSLKELNKPKIAEIPVAAPKSPEQVVSPYQQQIKEIKQWRPTGLRPTDAIAQVGSYLGHTLKSIPKSIYDYLTYR